MGDEVRFIKVIVVVGIISGDNKSGDAICGRFRGKNCHHHVSRLCMTGYKDLDDLPMLLLPCLSACVIWKPYKKEQPTQIPSEKEPNKYCNAFFQG
jgi:hypothetical protein